MPRPRRIPPILLEGDEMPTPLVSGPGRRFALGPTPPMPPTQPMPASPALALGAAAERLPAAYGTRRLWLAARDPHWLYANWDLSAEEMEEREGSAVSGHLTLRIHENAVGPAPVLEIPLARGARSWFVRVGRGGVQYIAELGCAEPGLGWQTLLTSNPVTAPPDGPAMAAETEFATIPIDVPFAAVVEQAVEAARQEESLAQALDALRDQGFADLPSAREVRAPVWTEAQERALAEVLRVDAHRRVWVSSLDVTGLIAERLGPAAEKERGGEVEQPSSPAGGFAAGEAGGISSPSGEGRALERERGFWFNVNAELVIYGATEPDAQVTIAGRAIKLRPDGSFSLRFALPDGEYELPVVARSRTGDDGRSAELQFRRHTEYRGAVGAHPQDPRLAPPHPESITSAGAGQPG